MAKTAKQTERDLVERLRGLGLRKRHAKNIAHTASSMKGQLPDSARAAIKEMASKLDGLGVGVAKKSKHSDSDAPLTEAERKAAKKAGRKQKGKKKGKKKGRKKGKTKGKKEAGKKAKVGEKQIG